jgi:putative SOS response-associated peptidase YedK
MCGRYVISDDKEIQEINSIIQGINKKYNGTGLAAKTGEIFPTDTVPILAMLREKPLLWLMRWGFPKWDEKGVIINARSESAAEKALFSDSLIERRCVVPSTGFYEWRRAPDGKPTKDKFLFNVDNSPMLYMAAIYTEAPRDGLVYRKFAILTRSANACIRDIHNRMPVILHKNELVRWLKDDDFVSTVFNRDDIRLVKEAV